MKISLEEGEREATPIRIADSIINLYSEITTNKEDARSNVKEVAMHLLAWTLNRQEGESE
jgi:hypothetical protein